MLACAKKWHWFQNLICPSLFTFFFFAVSEFVFVFLRVCWAEECGTNAWKCAGILSQHFNRLQRASRQVQTSFLRETSAWTDCLSSLVRFRFYFFNKHRHFIQHIQRGTMSFTLLLKCKRVRRRFLFQSWLFFTIPGGVIAIEVCHHLLWTRAGTCSGIQSRDKGGFPVG